MNFKELNPPIVEFPEHQIWHRIQRLKARKDSIRINGFVLAPTGGLTGRFDLADEACAYLADSELTALYESLFRRESRSCHWDSLEERAIASFQNVKRLRLVDVRGLEEQFPVLQSLRYESTQSFAAQCRRADTDGILYASAQHPHHRCVCLFEAGVRKTKRIVVTPLVRPGTQQLHRIVLSAVLGSEISIVQS